MENLSLLTTELSLNYVDLRKSLEVATSVAKQQVDVQTKAADRQPGRYPWPNKRSTRTNAASLLTKVDELQTANDKQATELAQPQDRESNSRKKTSPASARHSRRSSGSSATSSSEEGTDPRPTRRLCHLRRLRDARGYGQPQPPHGRRPQMKMTIFDARSPGIPTEKPKGNIELTSVGETVQRLPASSRPTAQSTRSASAISSTRPAWSPNQPMRFALVGKMDVNRDSRDDRDELKRMIQEAGGTIDFDLPPADLGKETGALSPADRLVRHRRPASAPRCLHTPVRRVPCGRSQAQTDGGRGDQGSHAERHPADDDRQAAGLPRLRYEHPGHRSHRGSRPQRHETTTVAPSDRSSQPKPAATPTTKAEDQGDAEETKDADETKKDEPAAKKADDAADDDQPKPTEGQDRPPKRIRRTIDDSKPRRVSCPSGLAVTRPSVSGCVRLAGSCRTQQSRPIG